MPLKKPSLIVIVLLTLAFSGCVDDHQLLAQVHEYFPGAQLYKFDNRVLWIQTQVDGVTPKFAEQTFLHFVQEADTSAMQKSFGIVHFSDALAHDGYIYLVLGFRQGVEIWDRRTVVGPNGTPTTLHWNLTNEQAPIWFTQHLGYVPQPSQIVIVNQ